MGISASEAERIHKLAQAANIPDETIQEWTEAEGGYRYAITSHIGSIKSAGAQAVRARIARHGSEAAAPRPDDGEPAATPRQVQFILDLLDRRRREGIAGGFMSGPTDRDGVTRLSRREASLYITSLREDY